MNMKKRTYGFGVDPTETENHFFVVIPPKNSQEQIEVYERFQWTPKGLSQEELIELAGNKDSSEPVVFSDGQIIQKHFTKILQKTPGMASLIVSDGICFEGSGSLPTKSISANRLYLAFEQWTSLFREIHLGLTDKHGNLTTLWYQQSHDCVKFSFADVNLGKKIIYNLESNDKYHFPGYNLHRVYAQATWPWIISFEKISNCLSKMVKAQTYFLKDSIMEQEYLWKCTLEIKGAGELFSGEVHVNELKTLRKIAETTDNCYHHGINLSDYFKLLDRCNKKQDVIKPPFPVGDIDHYEHGWIWGNYSETRMLERIQFIYEKALELYPILQTVSAKLTWSHYVELLKIDDPMERSFYEKESENEHWGVRELKRQMKSMLFHRLALSTDKKEVLRLSREGQIIERPEDILKEPYVFEFTGLPKLPVYEEGDLEEALVNNLSLFFLELGKGFAYIGRQQKMVIGGRIYKVDLVFYHRILKCFVLIDLKRGEVLHEDIGQMNFYLNYYREEMNTEGDTEPIGIILGAYKDKLVMHYALQNITNQVFVSHYQLYLPDREQLEAEFRRFMGDEAERAGSREKNEC